MKSISKFVLNHIVGGYSADNSDIELPELPGGSLIDPIGDDGTDKNVPPWVLNAGDNTDNEEVDIL